MKLITSPTPLVVTISGGTLLRGDTVSPILKIKCSLSRTLISYAVSVQIKNSATAFCFVTCALSVDKPSGFLSAMSFLFRKHEKQSLPADILSLSQGLCIPFILANKKAALRICLGVHLKPLAAKFFNLAANLFFPPR